MTIKKSLKKYFKFSIKDTCNSILVLFLAWCICWGLSYIDNVGNFFISVFLLAVFIISLCTKGFFYGIVSSFISVIINNFFFTYPFFKFNFTLSGYPLNIICSLTVAIITSILTTRIKEHSQIKIEAEKEKTRGNLLRSVSHDLRTPLTSIIGASLVIKDNVDTLSKEKIVELSGDIAEDAQWLIRMVENILSITRLDNKENAKITKNDEIVDEIIESSVAKFKKYFPEKKVNVSVPNELIMVPMDATLIEQVIVNLLENAAIHSNSDEQIELNVKKEKSYAAFEVIDHGDGIDEKILPKIFEGAHSVKNMNETDEKKNMGIGLSVCNTIVKAHDGYMSAENRQEGGAVFKFYIPLEEEDYEAYSFDS